MDNKQKSLLTTVIVIAGILFVLVAFVIVPSIRIVPQGEVFAVRRFGVVEESLQPGLHFRLAFMHTVDSYDVLVRAETVTFAAHTTDAQSVRGYVTVQYRIDHHRIVDIAHEYGPMSLLVSRLQEVFLYETQNVFATKSAMDLVQQRALLAPEIRSRLENIAEQYFITIVMVTLEELAFSEDFERSIEMVAIANQERLRAEEEAARDMILAQRDLDVAELQADQVVVHAKADAEALRIMQEAWGDLGFEVRDVMLRQLAITAWDGVLPQVIGGSDFSLILDNFN